jgi:hypothetical protein
MFCDDGCEDATIGGGALEGVIVRSVSSMESGAEGGPEWPRRRVNIPQQDTCTSPDPCGGTGATSVA